MLGKLFGKKETVEINNLEAYVSGKAICLKDVDDGVFSEGVLGEGMAIIPSEEIVGAPADAKVTTVSETKHAIGLQLNNGIQLLIHIGIDTVSMNGKGFEVFVSEGDKVKKGQKLIHFNKKDISDAGFQDTVVMVIVENENNRQIEFLPFEEVKVGESMIVNLK